MTAERSGDIPAQAFRFFVEVATADPMAAGDLATQISATEAPALPPDHLGGAGDDSLAGGDGDDRLEGAGGHDVLYGNGGNDALFGGDGNDHIYGFNIAGDPTADGNDTIRAGAGGDYVQGNAGDDLIYGDDGNDRLNGGGGEDNIWGGDGNDSINGNKGRDYLHGGTGNDTIRGGQGDDEVVGEEGDDILYGDLGDDMIYGGAGHDTLTGGQGSDVFGFLSGDARYSVASSVDMVDTITDFEDGTDRFGIGLGSGIGTAFGDVLRAPVGGGFATVDAALAAAQALLDGHPGTSDIAALQVGNDSYLFYNDSGGSTINSIVRVVGLASHNISEADFAMLDRTSTTSDWAVAS